MAISITSLSPSKGQANVPVATDVELTLLSDSVDLDITKIKFKVNGIEIQASAYYGGTNAEVNVSFFPKRKIKYDTRRYGQTDVRYGQRDIFPSAFQYGQFYVCTIYIEDVSGLTFEENFSFTIEEGIFYNQNINESFYHPQTQSVANYTPPWARSRYDKFSNMQQIVNAPGKFLQEIEDSLFKQTTSYYVQTANLNDLSTLYKVELGGDFAFETTVLDDGTTLQIPPDVSAIKEITKFNPTAEFQNDIKTFYFNKLPSRLDESKTTITDLVIVSKTKASDVVLNINKMLEREGHISLIIEDGTRFTQLENNVLGFTSCRIKGQSRERKDQIEDLVIIDNDTYFTSKLWSRIDSIQFINLPDNSNIHFTVDHARPVGSFVPDSFSNVSVDDEEKSTFWKMENSTYGSVLQQWVLLEVDAEDVISSLGQKNLISEFELLDIDNSTNLNLIDIDTDPFTNFIYGIDSDYLYIFDKREDYPDIVKLLPEENGTADFVLDLDADELGRGDSVKRIGIIGTQKTVSKQIAQYRISVIRPDGNTEYILSDGTIITDKTLASNIADNREAQLITSTVYYDLDIVGDYVVNLETVYRDGTTDRDAKIVRLHKKAARAKYKLERIFDGASIERIFVDFDQQLKILDGNKELHTISFPRDNVLIDYGNAVLYFNENYDEVEVE